MELKECVGGVEKKTILKSGGDDCWRGTSITRVGGGRGFLLS
jgi:hypothetical protein